MTLDTSATRNDLLNVHVVFTCDIKIFPIGSMFYVSIYVVNNAVSGTIFYITYKPLFQITTKISLRARIMLGVGK